MWRRTVIDLTALLDVILILLFLVLNSAASSVEQMKETAAENEQSIARLEEEYAAALAEGERLARAVDSFHALDERARIITIYVEQSGEDGARDICVEAENVTRKFSLTWSNEAVVERALLSDLTRLCGAFDNDSQQIAFLSLRYDRHNIYQSDYMLLSRVVTRVKQSCNNVYSAEYDIKENDDGSKPQ